MTLSSNVQGPNWRVFAQTSPEPGGFVCRIRVEHDGARGAYSHEFTHATRSQVEREALLAGLREGMLWIDHKVTQTFVV